MNGAVDHYPDITCVIQECISILSNRVEELRKIRVKKASAYKGLIKLAGECWRTSRYGLGISSLKTLIYRIDDCIQTSLCTIDGLGSMVALIRNSHGCYKICDVIELSKQTNYKCLFESYHKFQTSCPTQLFKQRSDEWKKVRSKAFVTGSTVFTALGLDTLKAKEIILTRFLESPLKILTLKSNESQCSTV